MLIDLENASTGLSLEADICIVGAGAAGVALARQLMSAGHDICLLESGGMDFEEATQELFSGANIGMEYYELDHSRLRFFGGTTNIYGAAAIFRWTVLIFKNGIGYRIAAGRLRWTSWSHFTG